LFRILLENVAVSGNDALDIQIPEPIQGCTQCLPVFDREFRFQRRRQAFAS
jgi:hypothetical protein